MRRQVGEHNPFLRQCQMHLGHKLPLSAYLLKPVQRITKYQLLLKVILTQVAKHLREAPQENQVDTQFQKC